VDLRKRDWRRTGRRGLLSLPFLFVAAFLVVPLALTIVISFWERVGVKFRPAFSFTSYIAIIEGARLDVLLRTFIVSVEATALSLLIAYPIAYFLARKASRSSARAVLLLFTIPFLINYIIRNVAWTGLLGRNGTINSTLIALGLRDAPIDSTRGKIMNGI
jgi:ABC-type spermidine/putrescine transport system permease subunit I